MKIVHISPEHTPLCKVGGLADVVSGLSSATEKLGHEITIILPFYDTLPFQKQSLKKPFQGPHFDLYEYFFDSIRVLLIDFPQDDFFSRGTIYGGVDEIIRYLHFTKAAAHFLDQSEEKYDVLHVHDWAASSIFLFTKAVKIKKKILTIHNIRYQGKATLEDLLELKVDEKIISSKELLDSTEPGKYNLLKNSFYHVDHITVVSPTYAREISKKPFAFGLHNEVIKHNKKIIGILNGIDTSHWSFKSDPFIEFNSKSSSLEEIQEAKKRNKESLLKKLNLKQANGPLVCSITRMVEQKGPKLIDASIEFTRENSGNFILLYGAAEPTYEDYFLKKSNTYLTHPHIRLRNGFDEAFAHNLYASADIIVIPSSFEPCGLTQMISMRYGTIPVVHETGGLKDTVDDFDCSKNQNTKKNGFSFSSFNEESMKQTLGRAFIAYKDHTKWSKIMKAAISMDFSWHHSALEYQKIYLS